jgi:hypothetical protein
MRRTVDLRILQPNSKARVKALRFYDPELQDASNADPPDPERLKRALLKSKKLHRAYQRQLAQIRGSVSAQTYRRFAKKRDPLFDSNLLSFSFGDSVFSRGAISRWPSFEARIEVRFLSFEGGTVHILKYRGIYAMSIHVPHERWYAFPNSKPQIDSLLFHQVTSAGPKAIKHEFLFHSGTTIEIICGKMHWDSHKSKIARP